MQATLFEFRNRWWIFFALFSVAFFLYAFDHVNFGIALTDWVAKLRGVTATDNSYRITFGCGALLLALAALVRTWGTSYLQADVMRDIAVHTEKLVSDGPYRYVRNPLYLGNILMAAGVGVMASRVGFVVLLVGMIIFVLRLLLREEAELLRDQGESYRRYYEAVPRLLPSITPRVPAAGHAPNWGSAFRVELMYWLESVAVTAFAVTLKIVVFWVLFVVAMSSSFWLKRPGERKPSGAS